MGEYLSSEEVKNLIIRIKSGDNEAWDSLYHNFEKYVHKCAWNRLQKLNMSENRKKDMEEELYQSGWQGFLSAVQAYDPKKGEFLTYATYFIDGEMSKTLKLIWNPFEITENIEPAKIPGAFEKGISVEDAPDRGNYSPERRVLQIMEILRLLTDEEHSLSKTKLSEMIRLYRIAKYHNGTPLENPRTLADTVEDMLMEVNPLSYTDENDHEYKIKYKGYKEDRLKAKKNKESGKKAPDITEFSYVHTFTREELDRLIQLVCFSDMLSNEDKQQLVSKLASTASVYYRTPFLQPSADGKDKIRFHPQAVHGRFSGRRFRDKRQFAENIKLIQQAINNLCQIRFRFNCYTAEHEMIPKSEYLHVLSPYHLVVYHDYYYCIGLKKENKRIWHYRVDLMSDVEILTTDDKKAVPIDICTFEELPICNAYWDPEKYMAEHLYMAYDEPREIRIKIRNTDYTILHDWFGDYYKKINQPCEEEYDIVEVRTSPDMVVHWAMQYAGAVEVMDEEIREKIRDEIKKLQEKYL